MGQMIGISYEEYELLFLCSHDANPEMFLGKNAQYAFLYTPPQDPSEALIQSEGGWELFRFKMDAIAKTFKLLNQMSSYKVVYENKEFGFSLELPMSWKGYTVKTTEWNESLKKWDNYKITPRKWDDNIAINFYFPTNDATGDGKPGQASLLTLYVESQQSWNQYPDCKTNYEKALGEHGCPREDQKIGETADYVMTAVGAQWAPDDLVSINRDLVGDVSAKEGTSQYFKQLSGYIEYLKKGFKTLP
jgi:hypothetical protein